MKFAIGVLKEKSFKHIIRIFLVIDNESKIYVFQLWVRLIDRSLYEMKAFRSIEVVFTNHSDFIFKDSHNS
ncbi:hypothetical protein GXP75_12265 [Bacillus sp. HU-1818]|nr:hypothetical protein [Bacillus sp. HU-1818]